MSEIKTVMNSSGERICVETFGSDEATSTIVFCHGITGCRGGRTQADSYFQQLASSLAKDNKVVLFDYSGHGDSEGKDYAVCPSKSEEELARVFSSEVSNDNEVSFLAFSYGATVLCNFLASRPDVSPRRIVLYSPCLYPIESCFLNKKSVFGKDIVKAIQNGDMDNIGYALVGAKGFKAGINLIQECRDFNPRTLSRFSSSTLVCTGLQDVILDISYNERFCSEHKVSNVYFNASHSLFEKIDDVFSLTEMYMSWQS